MIHLSLWATLFSLAFGATVASANPIEGLWRTETDGQGRYAFVQMVGCGPYICGLIVRAEDTSGGVIEYPFDDRPIIWDMQDNGLGAYDGGRIWAPDMDLTFRARMQLRNDILEVEGCVVGFCRGQQWTRQ